MANLLYLIVLLFTSLLSVRELVKAWKINKLLNPYFLFIFAFSIYYIYIPLTVFVFFSNSNLLGFRFIPNIISVPVENKFISSLIILGAFKIIVYSFWNFYNRFKYSTRSILIKTSKDIFYTFKTKLFYISLVFFTVSVISLVVLVFYFEGIINLLSSAELIRSKVVLVTDFLPNQFAFVFTIFPFVHVSTFLFFALFRRNKDNINKVLFCISLLLSIVSLLLQASRMHLLLFIIVFFIDFIRLKSENYFKYIIYIGLFAIIGSQILEFVSLILRFGFIPPSSTNHMFYRIFEEFSFPYSNFISVYKINEEFGYRFGLDLIGWLTYLLPSSFLSVIGLRRISHGYDFITYFYNKGSTLRGGVPTDFLTMGFRQFDLLGALIVILLFVFLTAYIQSKLKSIESKRYTFLYMRISFLFFFIIPYADLDSFVRSHFFAVFILILVLYFSGNNERRKVSSKRDLIEYSND